MSIVDPDTAGRAIAFAAIAIGLSGVAEFSATALARRLSRKQRSIPFLVQWAKLTAVLTAIGTCTYLADMIVSTVAAQ